jgi:predicted TIM-barrel fold metal-dependent hydrolase
MFGTDFPWGNSKSIIDNIEKLNVTKKSKNAIFYGNAKKS